MAFDFGFTLFFLDPPSLTNIEIFFIQVQSKLNIHQRHSQTTVRLYQQELESELKVQKIELQKAMAIAEAQYKKSYAEIEGSDYDKHSFATHEAGIDELNHHYAALDEQTKMDYVEMADHYNKSAVATLYALLESELRRLCGRAMVHFSLSFPVERFEKSDYLFSMIEYLKLVALIDTNKAETFLPKLQQLQFLRNRIMHNGAEFNKEANDKLDNLVNGNKATLFFEDIPDEGTRILRVRSKFIDQYYEVISDFFLALFTALNVKFTYSFLIERIRFMFRFLSSDALVTLSNEKDIKNGKQFVFNVSSDNEKNPFVFNLKLTVATATSESVTITNQLGEIRNLERWVEQMTLSNEVLRQSLVGYLDPKSSHKIDLLLYPVD